MVNSMSKFLINYRHTLFNLFKLLKTRLAVGHYTSNPESKILLAMNSNSTTGAMDSWDIIPATNNPGTYVLQMNYILVKEVVVHGGMYSIMW